MSLKGHKGITRNRNKLDIVRDMLAIASTKAKKTKIMYQANLNYVQVEKYMKTLLDEELLACDGDGNGGSFYIITDKGQEFLKLYDKYIERRRNLSEEVDGAAKHRQMLEKMCFNTKNEVNQ